MVVGLMSYMYGYIVIIMLNHWNPREQAHK